MSPAPEKRFVLITGCGEKSIGRALTQEFVQRGFEVIATVLPGEKRSHLDIPHCHVHEADVTDEASIERLHGFVQDLTKGSLDILVNSAGIVYQYPAVDYEMDLIEKLVAAQGIVINIGSISYVFPCPYEAAYCGTKAAVYQYSNTLRLELAPLGVRVIMVCSGEVNTNLLEGDAHRRIPEGSLYEPMQQRYLESTHRENVRMEPEVFVKAVVKNAVASRPKIEIWHGTWSRSTRFIHRFLPRSTFDYFARLEWSLGELATGTQSLSARFARKYIRSG